MKDKCILVKGGVKKPKTRSCVNDPTTDPQAWFMSMCRMSFINKVQAASRRKKGSDGDFVLLVFDGILQSSLWDIKEATNKDSKGMALAAIMDCWCRPNAYSLAVKAWPRWVKAVNGRCEIDVRGRGIEYLFKCADFD